MAQARPSRAILDYVSVLRDPRQQWRVIYPLPEILLVVLCATLCGMDGFVETKLWGEPRLDVLRRFLPYERGIPAHDTLNDVVNALDPDLFKACFASGVETLQDDDPEGLSGISCAGAAIVDPKEVPDGPTQSSAHS